MKNEVKALVTILATVATMTANAGYSIYMPLDKGSIVFSKVVEDIEEKTPSELCDDYANEANIFLLSNYADVHLLHHEYTTIVLPVTGPKSSCVLALNVPDAKAFHCVGNSSYTGQLGVNLNTAVGGKYNLPRSINYSYYGNCE
ncbi:TPA: hypothetical protein L5P95_004252 [Pseudomonas aeruginosa]|uniref:hypothetical protein n=1 Tax=Pseudomonas TaxID=286 RepID=UPI0012986E1D|nr:hypothetical protein [Pseudomonas aeruginosa]EKW6684639.1 hypothetical protein [Pseudomonas aeruginosa]MCM0292702.1 hypothetical protein [Pseudomonas aeruginosa]NYU51082.1 hypothetical protein [Pseudomonas aeruginosa]HBO6006769.1 hypothetical protein [Pseudomonas aeruginosa]HBP0356866.1 hypothetical protein [Pseudomonas aeruginosa]